MKARNKNWSCRKKFVFTISGHVFQIKIDKKGTKLYVIMILLFLYQNEQTSKKLSLSSFGDQKENSKT